MKKRKNSIVKGMVLVLIMSMLFSSMLQIQVWADWEKGPINPEYESYIHKLNSGEDPLSSIKIGEREYKLGKIPTPFIISNSSSQNLMRFGRMSKEFLPTRYDLREKGKLTSVKNQGQYGTCWAFAGMASLESYLLPLKEYNFSENHLAYGHGYFNKITLDDGGFPAQTWSYFLRWEGPVNEEDDPYDGVDRRNMDIETKKHVQNTRWIVHGKDFTNNEGLKKAILKYGAVDSAVYVDDAMEYLLNYNHYSYYSGTNNDKENERNRKGNILTNHEITLVGWDDDYPKENFVITPPGDGAFIVRNSWGKNFGDEGYFYLSYYDIFDDMEDDEKITLSSIYMGESVENYKNIYQYDPLGLITLIGDKEYEKLYGANIFTAKEDEKIEGVGFYAVVDNLSYKIWIFSNAIESGTALDLGDPIKEGILQEQGYHTIELDDLVEVKEGEQFSVIVEFSAPRSDFSYLVPVENFLYGFSENASANPGESMLGLPKENTVYNEVYWSDITDIDSTANICIKAYSYKDTVPKLEAYYPNQENNLFMEETDEGIFSFSKRIFPSQEYENIYLLNKDISTVTKNVYDTVYEIVYGNEHKDFIVDMDKIIDNDRLKIKPIDGFRFGEKYTLLIPQNAVEDKGGKNLEKDYKKEISLPTKEEYLLHQAQQKLKYRNIVSPIYENKLNLIQDDESIGDKGIKIIWESKDQSLVDNEGNVLKPLDQITTKDKVKLIARFILGEKSVEKSFDVKLNNYKEIFYTHKVRDALTFDQIKGENNSLYDIRSNLRLIKDGSFLGDEYKDVLIEWTSRNENSITNDGVVHQGLEDQNTYLIALIRMKGNMYADVTSSFPLTVKASEPSISKGGSRGGGSSSVTNKKSIQGSLGGSLEKNGATVTIPKNAFDGEIDITIEKISDISKLPLSKEMKFMSNVVEIKKNKEGLFKKPVHITIDYNLSKVDLEKYDLGIFWLNEETKEWIKLDDIHIDEKNKKVSGEINHFTKFAVIAIEKTENTSIPIHIKDIDGHWAEENVKELIQKYGITGYSDHTFKPEDPITRAEFTSILVKVLQLKGSGKIFLDTKDHWAKDVISIAQRNEIASGYEDGNFRPDEYITREQMVAMLAKAMKLSQGKSTLDFIDSKDISSWAIEPLKVAVQTDLIKGYPGNILKPKGYATRAEAATMIKKGLDLSSTKEIKVGEEFQIQLEENITTGATWHVDIDNENMIKIITSEYKEKENQEGRKGAGGIHTWVVKGLKEGKTKIHFRLYQDWNKDTIYQTRDYTIHVLSK
ncbi:lectin like domain-containing protein [Anaerophilus nitritogenes]|uniref:lectin like domain-containing protein n=1 Tax=Anaerophilus nitritogenes TaxID=2498136 RepID=UPI00101E1656|nr:lectin like domain-containing protein [Anaerophilus nitritogenes]